MSRSLEDTSASALTGIHVRVAALAIAVLFGREALRWLTPWPPHGARLTHEILSAGLVLYHAALVFWDRLHSRVGSWALLVFSGLLTLGGGYLLVVGAFADGLWFGLCGAVAFASLALGLRRRR